MSTSCAKRLSQPWAEMLQDARLDRRPGTLDSVQNLRADLGVPSPLWIPVSLTVIGLAYVLLFVCHPMGENAETRTD